MADHSNFAICNQIREDLRRFDEDRIEQQNMIAQLTQQVRYREGEISVADNILSTILDGIQNVGSSAVSAIGNLLLGDRARAAGDGVMTAVKLSNEVARQRQELTNLQRMLANDKWQLQSARDDMGLIEQDIYLATNHLRANDC